MDACVLCGGLEFYIEAGYYFCKECQTQNEEKREEVVEFRADVSTRIRKTRIRRLQSASGSGDVVGWTTWEMFNFILIGLTNELIELGASPSIKLTILQLWATYLNKIEVAFISTTETCAPKLARRYNKKDAEIIYGRIARRKKSVKSKSGGSTSGCSRISSHVSGATSKTDLSKVKKQLIMSEYDKYMKSQNNETDIQSVANQSSISQGSSISDASNKSDRSLKMKFTKRARKEKAKMKLLGKKLPKAKREKFKEKHISTPYAIGPDILTVKKLWGIIYLALRIHDDKIHLSDMLRFGREAHLSYFRLEHLFPPELSLTKSDISTVSPTTDISHRGLRLTIASLADNLGVRELPHPNFLSLIERYITNLELPKGILVYVERMIARSPLLMNYCPNISLFPNYEGRAMGYIIVIMKILFGLDGVTEYEISRVIDRINTVAEEHGELESKLFSFCEWQRFIECRRCILVKEHFPTHLKYYEYSSKNSHLYIRFLQSINSKYEGDDLELTVSKGLMPSNLTNVMKQSMQRLCDKMPLEKNVISFPSSLTPEYSYLRKLFQDSDQNLPSILRQDFSATKVGYMLKPESLKELAENCGIELHIITASAHFMKKIVQVFEPLVMPSIDKQTKLYNLNTKTTVIAPSAERGPIIKESDDPSEYLHRKNPGEIVIDSKKKKLYSKAINSNTRSSNNNDNDFGFDNVLKNGKLNVPSYDYESDEEISKSDSEKSYNLVLSNFEKESMINPIPNPYVKQKRKKLLLRGKDGKFIKQSTVTDSVSKKKRNKTQSQDQNKVISVDDEVNNHNDSSNDPIIVNELPQLIQFSDSDPDEISILSENISSRQNSNTGTDSKTPTREILTLFRPYKQYWMYRFARPHHMSSNHFRLMERNFPTSFRWLLNLCADAIEMNPVELFKEVSLIEKYYADVLSPKDDPKICKNYNTS